MEPVVMVKANYQITIERMLNWNENCSYFYQIWINIDFLDLVMFQWNEVGHPYITVMIMIQLETFVMINDEPIWFVMKNEMGQETIVKVKIKQIFLQLYR